MIVGWCWGWKA